MHTPRQRERISEDNLNGMSVTELIVLMAEGNAGATVAMGEIMKADVGELGYVDILYLDDMNIRGAQIWICYKDFCNCDVKNFLTRIQARDPAMIHFVNNHRGHEGHKAVTNGASYMDDRSGLVVARDS